MKIIFSEIKKWLPDLKVSPDMLRNDLTLIGHFVSGVETINGEIIFDLEIRQNRGDCLGYYGIAKDLAVYYELKLVLPIIEPIDFGADEVSITIESSDVFRIQATKISDLKNSVSPLWLSEFLKFHDINSINTLVDLTNYVMLIWGIPCHAFDHKKSPQLIWENTTKPIEFTSLDGTKLTIKPGTLSITNHSDIVSLSFIGGQNSAIDLNSTETIIEMAVYNRSRVRNDSRDLKTITEASIRLDKELDAETIPLAFSHLVSLILKYCHGKLTSKLLDIYKKANVIPQIEFDAQKPSQYAGVNISADFSIKTLSNLGCQINHNQIIPPTIRKDLIIEEDLIEEVIRFYGYNKIPTNQPISSEKLPDITPPILYLIDKLKDEYVKNGFDEVRSWPLVKKPINSKTAVFTQNSINSDYPVLRQSIIQSLKDQLDQYQRFKLQNQKIFEIGKIFHQIDGQYIEQYALASYDGTKFTEIILDNLVDKANPYTPASTSNQAFELNSQIITLDANVTIKNSDPATLIKHYSSLIDSNILWSIEITDIYQSKYTFRVRYYNCDDKTAKKIHLKTFNLI